MPAAKAAGKSGKKGTAAKTSAKSNGSTRASEAELDRLAAKVVSLRDDKGLAWGDIEEQLEIAPSRLRALYNRGGGEPTTRAAAKPAAKGAKGKTAASAKGKGRAASKRGKKADPSDED
jgi:hypothetical protein